ncbi:MAG: hypothetical protein IJB83_01190 [Bacilli bacterium]|nr:hypothetical protein [Bacilli bacterium]
MSEELLIAYNKLDIVEKRNAMSNELMMIGQMLRTISHDLNMESDLKVKNYDSSKENITEDDTLTFLYEDVYNIKREILQIFNYISIKKKTNNH